jgi:hypothetical protein
MEREELLRPLTAVVQYRRKDQTAFFDPWRTMAAFDVPGAAESYCKAQSETAPWEYRWLEIPAHVEA